MQRLLVDEQATESFAAGQPGIEQIMCWAKGRTSGAAYKAATWALANHPVPYVTHCWVAKLTVLEVNRIRAARAVAAGKGTFEAILDVKAITTLSMQAIED